MIEVYKVLNGKYDNDVSSLLPRRITQVNQVATRGHSKKLLKKKATSDISKHMFTRRVTDIWNSLPENVVSAPSLYAFENHLDKHWRRQNIVYDFEATLELIGSCPTEHRDNPDQTDDHDLGRKNRRNP